MNDSAIHAALEYIAAHTKQIAPFGVE